MDCVGGWPIALGLACNLGVDLLKFQIFSFKISDTFLSAWENEVRANLYIDMHLLMEICTVK